MQDEVSSMPKATIVFRDREWQVDSGTSVREAIEQADLDPTTLLAVRGKKLISNKTTIEAEDRIELIHMISGG